MQKFDEVVIIWRKELILKIPKVILKTPLPDDEVLIIHLKNDKHRREEIYEGNSFVLKSSKFILLKSNITSVEFINQRAKKNGW